MAERRPNTEAGGSSRVKTRWIILAIAGILFLGVVAFVGFQFTSCPLVISEETTYITEPLKSDGRRVDYFRAFEEAYYSDDLATDRNGVRLLFERVDLSAHSTPALYEQILRKLGLDPSTHHPDLAYETIEASLIAYMHGPDCDEALVRRVLEAIGEEGESPTLDLDVAAGKLHGRVLRAPWTLDEIPMMEAWLDKNDPVLDLLGEAVRKPTFQFPMVRESEDAFLFYSSNPYIFEVKGSIYSIGRPFMRGLRARAKYRIGTGDIDGAIDDFITTKRLGRHAFNGDSRIVRAFGDQIEGMADKIDPLGSPDHPPTRAQVQRFLDELERLPPRASDELRLLRERYEILDVYQALATDQPGSDELGRYQMGDANAYLERMSVDWNFVLRETNRQYDAYIATGAAPLKYEQNWRLFLSRGARSAAILDAGTGRMLRDQPSNEAIPLRGVARDQKLRIELALRLHEFDQGGPLPAYTVDDEGRPLHSWRVLLLPYLGEKELYDKIRLDEPWDSEHNRAFHALAPACYHWAYAEGESGDCSLTAVPGPDGRLTIVDTNVPSGWMVPNEDSALPEATGSPP